MRDESGGGAREGTDATHPVARRVSTESIALLARRATDATNQQSTPPISRESLSRLLADPLSALSALSALPQNQTQFLPPRIHQPSTLTRQQPFQPNTLAAARTNHDALETARRNSSPEAFPRRSDSFLCSQLLRGDSFPAASIPHSTVPKPLSAPAPPGTRDDTSQWAAHASQLPALSHFDGTRERVQGRSASGASSSSATRKTGEGTASASSSEKSAAGAAWRSLKSDERHDATGRIGTAIRNQLAALAQSDLRYNGGTQPDPPAQTTSAIDAARRSQRPDGFMQARHVAPSATSLSEQSALELAFGASNLTAHQNRISSSCGRQRSGDAHPLVSANGAASSRKRPLRPPSADMPAPKVKRQAQAPGGIASAVCAQSPPFSRTRSDPRDVRGTTRITGNGDEATGAQTQAMREERRPAPSSSSAPPPLPSFRPKSQAKAHGAVQAAAILRLLESGGRGKPRKRRGKPAPTGKAGGADGEEGYELIASPPDCLVAPSLDATDPSAPLHTVLERGGNTWRLVGEGEGEDDEARVREQMRHHSESEKRRREKINQHVATLKALLPDVEKADKATVLAAAVEAIQSLQTEHRWMPRGTADVATAHMVSGRLLASPMNQTAPAGVESAAAVEGSLRAVLSAPSGPRIHLLLLASRTHTHTHTYTHTRTCTHTPPRSHQCLCRSPHQLRTQPIATHTPCHATHFATKW